VAATLLVVMPNFAEVAPAATVTVAGTVTHGSELLNVTTAPPKGAGPFTYAQLLDDGVPPTRAAGDSVTIDAPTGFTVRIACLLTPPYAAEIVTVLAAATLIVVILNCAEVAPAATVTLAGTVADGSELLSVTTAPADRAGPFRETVLEVEGGTPPTKAAGDKVTEDNATGLTVRVAVFVPPYAAEIVTLVTAATLVVVMLNFADVAPAATVTVAGTVAAAFELVNVTTAPLDGAAPFRYTVFAEEGKPPTNAAGDTLTDDTAIGLTVSVPVFVTPA